MERRMDGGRKEEGREKGRMVRGYLCGAGDVGGVAVEHGGVGGWVGGGHGVVGC